MQPSRSLQRSLEPGTGSYPEPYPSIPQPQTQFFKMNINIVFVYY